MDNRDPNGTEISIHITKYMGCKRPLLEFIVPIVRRYVNKGQTVLDLFAGTHTIGYALKRQFRIVANDIQQYSLAIGEAIVSNHDRMRVSSEEVCARLVEPYKKNYRALRSALAGPIKQEQQYIEGYNRSLALPLFHQSDQLSMLLKGYETFSKKYPYYRSNGDSENAQGDAWDQNLSCLFQQWISDRKADPNTFPYTLFTTYYANGYFGVYQSVVIDSLRYAIDQCYPKSSDSEEEHLLRNICFSAMMYAASYCVAAPGHFAQFISFNPGRESAYRAVFHHRSQSFLERFESKLHDIYDHLIPSPYENRCYAMDYRDIISDDDLMAEIDLVYADPPYTSVHYSRFYHILETLVQYDYPESTYIGRYRGDRHQSGFCQKSNVVGEFRNLLKSLSDREKKLIISYPDTGLMPLSQLLSLCREYYLEPNWAVEEVREDYSHSTLGGKTGSATKDVTEALIVCSPRATR